MTSTVDSCSNTDTLFTTTQSSKSSVSPEIYNEDVAWTVWMSLRRTDFLARHGLKTLPLVVGYAGSARGTVVSQRNSGFTLS